MKINCIIIDDEPLARKGLKEYIQDTDFLELSGEYENALKASNALLDQKVQLIFLDIQMPKITGMDFLRSLPHPPHVVFTTAYPQYAVEGFELNAADYLLKPFSFDRFLKAVLKVRSLVSGHAGTEPFPAEIKDHFFFKTD